MTNDTMTEHISLNAVRISKTPSNDPYLIHVVEASFLVVQARKEARAKEAIFQASVPVVQASVPVCPHQASFHVFLFLHCLGCHRRGSRDRMLEEVGERRDHRR